MKYKVYQIPFPKDENNEVEVMRYCKYAFSPLSRIDEVNLKNYKMTYEGEMPINLISDLSPLDQIFQELNINHPADYKGHSLSVSDLIEMNGKFYFCDSYGWEEVNFVDGVYVKAKS